ncbi:hypothetical protein EJ04DRAFT_511212 [Polyplosphaeria fusca]|uniref:Uncharacterized protein n=1 Tax=Polyplosphaeria fusca TaxID=682080 RepID=A0A9P4V4B7_9PLEO|nr:hypothetical protein EJ04DRAFT_511212 [Polyplosphaeria fusca]
MTNPSHRYCTSLLAHHTTSPHHAQSHSHTGPAHNTQTPLLPLQCKTHRKIVQRWSWGRK